MTISALTVMESYEEQLQFATPIAQPMASYKLAKRVYKLMKKARGEKKVVQGLKDIPKLILKGKKQGIVVIGGNITPLDVFSHIPLICEEKNIPYCYVASKEDIGAACGSLRPIAVVLIEESPKYEKLYKKCLKSISSLPLPIQ